MTKKDSYWNKKNQDKESEKYYEICNKELQDFQKLLNEYFNPIEEKRNLQRVQLMVSTMAYSVQINDLYTLKNVCKNQIVDKNLYKHFIYILNTNDYYNNVRKELLECVNKFR